MCVPHACMKTQEKPHWRRLSGIFSTNALFFIMAHQMPLESSLGHEGNTPVLFAVAETSGCIVTGNH